jgi:RHS repeat-associated protein
LEIAIFADCLQTELLSSKQIEISEKGEVFWENLQDSLVFENDGFAVVSLRNESEKEVLFDELNVRVYGTEKAVIIQENHYEPFGMTLKGLDYVLNPQQKNQFLFNGKELDESLDLQLYDYHARQVDPQTGRMTQVDPHASNYGSQTPYNYVFNRPLNMIDPDGKDGRLIISQDKEGNYSITFQTTVHLYGKDATKSYVSWQKENFDKLNKAIAKNLEGTGLSVKFDVSYQIHTDDKNEKGEVTKSGKEKAEAAMAGNAGDNTMEVDSSLKGWQVYGGFDQSSMDAAERNQDNPNIRNNKGRVFENRGKLRDLGWYTGLHETVHFFGFVDRYSAEGGTKNVHNGYQGDLMAGNDDYVNMIGKQFNHIISWMQQKQVKADNKAIAFKSDDLKGIDGGK